MIGTAEVIPPPLPRSSFVSVLAWISLAFAGMGVVSGVLQMLALAMSGSGDQMAALVSNMLQAPLPPVMDRIFRHLMLFQLASLAMSFAFTVASWGLLQRREWGRQGFIVMLLLSAVLGLVWTYLVAGMLDGFIALVQVRAGAVDPALAGIQSSMKAALYIGALVIAGIHSGIAWKLNQPVIRNEFS